MQFIFSQQNCVLVYVKWWCVDGEQKVDLEHKGERTIRRSLKRNIKQLSRILKQFLCHMTYVVIVFFVTYYMWYMVSRKSGSGNFCRWQLVLFAWVCCAQKSEIHVTESIC